VSFTAMLVAQSGVGSQQKPVHMKVNRKQAQIFKILHHCVLHGPVKCLE
jgi:hypothetical protein